MSLPHAILTALLEKPSSGLELTRRFDRSIGYFWSSTHQQIYRELGKLEQAGRIRALPTAAPARGQKKEYEVLPAGREELAAWVALPEDPRPVRDPLLLRMRAAAVVGVNGMETELRRHLALHESQWQCESTGRSRSGTSPLPRGRCRRLRHLVLRGRIDLETFWIGWLTRAIGDLEEG
ncbi:PadR family transcriptional regulator [Streptomyces sp. COG20]|uniref:PadR family transcriptional regulator n=1 Tax=Streptomyces sp. COG20 TaxID=2838871 RepID=UPI001EFC504C|nr:PadR family transcriptional regulator [Streptomyces sp. COG20]